MTATTVAPWEATEVDPDGVAAELQRRFPGVCVWFGEFTGHWWAVVRRELVEALDPVELFCRLETILPQGRPAPPRGVQTNSSGQWTAAAQQSGQRPAAPRPRRHARPDRPARWRRALGALVAAEGR